MAITRVSQGQEDYSTNTTTFTDALPGTLLPGDVVEFTVTTTSSTATTLTPAASTGTLFSSGVGTSDAVQSQGWYWVLPDPVPAAVSVTAAAARQGTLAWVAYRGVDSTTPMDAAPVQGNQGAASTSTPSMPSITTVTPGAMVVGGICHGSGSTTVTDSGPWTLLVDGTRRNGMIFEKGVQAAAGASGAQTFTLSAGQQSRMWVSALRPAAGEPADPPLEATLTSEPYPGFTGDVADGAAIVYDAANPGSSVVITTNKDTGGGLYVLGLDGQIMSSSLLGAANSVDWRDLTGVSGWDDRLLVMTSDRQINALRYYWLDRTTKALTAAGTTALGWEPYGTCLYVHSDGQVYAFVSQRGPDDTSARNFYQYPLSRSGSTVVAGSAVRTVNVANVVEGMAADDVTGGLFVSQEDVGLYRYSAAPGGGSTRTAVDTVGAGNLVADVEDVAVARTSAGAWLLVSSQGDSSYHVYDLATFEHVQRFTVVRPGGTDDVTSTDGLDVYLGNFGSAFPDGLIVVHDGDKTPVSDFAFVDAGLVFGPLPATAHAASGTVPATSAVAGAISARRPASGAAPVTSSVSGAATLRGAIAGTVTSTSGASGAVTVTRSTAGTVTAISTTSGALAGQNDVTGTVIVTSGSAGSATAVHTVSGTVAALSSAGGATTARHVLVGSVEAVSGVAGTITSESGSNDWPAVGMVTTVTTVAGTAVAHHTLSGAATAEVAVTGSIRAQIGAAGTVTAHSGAAGNVTVSGDPGDYELSLDRGPYRNQFWVGFPSRNPLTVSSPRR